MLNKKTCFKPYYNWNTFNTEEIEQNDFFDETSFKPYYNWNTFNTFSYDIIVVALALCFKPYYNWNTFNTLKEVFMKSLGVSFKPYYNWNTFNTSKEANYEKFRCDVLNLIITGIPSILVGGVAQEVVQGIEF